MGRIFSDKSSRDTELAVESLINPAITRNFPTKTDKHSSRLTITEQLQTSPQIDDLSDKKNH